MRVRVSVSEREESRTSTTDNMDSAQHINLEALLSRQEGGDDGDGVGQGKLSFSTH